jgi:hypothetical protein
MVKTVTNEMVRRALNDVVTHAQHTSTISRGVQRGEDNKIDALMEKVVTKVSGNTLICEDGTEATLVSPLPCLFWRCINTPDDKGVATLRKPVGALIITSNEINYCLGIIGESSEFEVFIRVGRSHLKVNSHFISLMSKHLVLNGIEEKKETEETGTTSNNDNDEDNTESGT